jgi:hypothetical protein
MPRKPPTTTKAHCETLLAPAVVAKAESMLMEGEGLSEVVRQLELSLAVVRCVRDGFRRRTVSRRPGILAMRVAPASIAAAGLFA